VALGAAILAVIVTMILALIRAVEGPSAFDRMLAANLFGTKTVLLIALGGYMLDWHSFLDIALLYALVNFVSTIAVMRFFESRDMSQGSVDDGGAP
jgi:multicomponent Na+:H+ antiporter subunit F